MVLEHLLKRVLDLRLSSPLRSRSRLFMKSSLAARPVKRLQSTITRMESAR